MTEAQSYLKGGTEEQQRAFALRQLRARQRVWLLHQFYSENPSSISCIHMTTACLVAIGRFCGYADSFNQLGEAIMPVDDHGLPKTREWAAYREACQVNRPWSVRDELWLDAHTKDWEALREADLTKQFYDEAAQNDGDPNWKRMLAYAEVSFGARLFEHLSLPQQTHLSFALGLAFKRLITRGAPLALYMLARLAGCLFLTNETRPDLLSYAKTARLLKRSLLAARGFWAVYKRGLRIKNRGVKCPNVEWPILDTLLGDKVEDVHPLITSFYRNPGNFEGTATLDLQTLPLMFYSRMATLLLGQGLYEGSPDTPIPARLNVFQRQDGTMHWIRELYLGDSLRVFDSDFLLRDEAGESLLVERFQDIGVEITLQAEVRPERGVAVFGRDIFWRGLKLPRTALKVEFASRVQSDAQGEFIDVLGTLKMQPDTRWGKFLMHTLLQRPEYLGSINYKIRSTRVC